MSPWMCQGAPVCVRVAVCLCVPVYVYVILWICKCKYMCSFEFVCASECMCNGVHVDKCVGDGLFTCVLGLHTIRRKMVYACPCMYIYVCIHDAAA